MATAKTITAFKYRTEVIADITKHTSEFKKADETVEKYGKTVQKVAKDTSKAFDGAAVGKKWGSEFGASAVASLTSSFSVSTLGGLIGTAIAPGIGTTIGSAIGGGIDTAISKVAPIILSTIDRGIALNKLLEDTRIEFKATVGSEQEANKYLNELLGISKDLGILPATVINTSEELSDLTGNLKLTRTLLKAAADQAADFAGTDFHKVASDLGLIAERGELIARDFKTLLKDGINAKKYLSEATGLGEKQLDRLIAAGRIRGDVATRLIAEGIEREKGGLAGLKTSQTVSGRERQFQVLTDLRSGEGTQQATRAIGDFYEKANAILDSPQAQAFTNFINNYTGKLIDFTEKSLKIGVSMGAGVAEGLLDFNPATMMQSFTKLADFTTSGLKTVFEIHSPSALSAREIGEPLGEGLGVGMVRRFSRFMANEGRDQIVATLEGLLQDPRIQALLKTIEKAEGGAPNRIVGGRTISDLSRHPNIVGLRTSKGPSTAAGSYQITGTNWRKIAPQLGLSDFGPHNQALAALSIIAGHPGGLQALMSGDITKLEKFIALDWTSTPGSRIGGGGQKSQQQWMSYYNQALAANGSAISDINPMPVRFAVGDIMGGASKTFGSGRGPLGDVMGGASSIFGTKNLKEYTLALDDADGAVVAFKVQMDDLITDAIVPGTQRFNELINSVQPATRALTPLIGAEKEHAATSIALTKEYQQAARDELIKGMSVLDQLSGAIGQISGMMPQQQVGKKRGLFSKMLGFAAPFLQFIPGVGPLLGAALTTIAGAASQGLAGNYGGMVSSIAGGLATGGSLQAKFFPGGGGGGGGATMGATGLGAGAGLVHRAAGGPVRRGQRYIVGERRPELFVPNSDGWIHPSVGGSGGGMHPEMLSLLQEIRDALTPFRTASPGDVLQRAVRERPQAVTEGLKRHMSMDGSVRGQLGRELGLK